MTTCCSISPPPPRWRPLVIALVAILGLAAPVRAADDPAVTRIVLWNRNYDTAPVNEVLKLALDETRDLFGPYKLVRSAPLEQDVAFNGLAKPQRSQDLDVASGATTPWREQHLLAIRLPVMKGLLGYRVCLTQKAQAKRFSNLQTSYDWQTHHLKICQAESWPDTHILRRNGFEVQGTKTYGELFSAVSNGHCDCFLRSVGEVGPELASHPGLSIEPSLLFLYPEPAYFFVRPGNTRLAARIELGLLRAMDDGRYDTLFQARFANRLAPLHLGTRTLFHLNNPDLSAPSRALLRDDTLWYKP